MPLDFLDAQHEAYRAMKDEWERAETLLRGGRKVVDTELVRFLWEDVTGDNFAGRKKQAIYPNFARDMAQSMVGHILREFPEADGGLNYGTLGEVKRAGPNATPSRAEQLHYNADGTGGDGEAFPGWLIGIFARAFGTGHRWVLCEMPPQQASTRQDELNGARPYGVEYSPLAVHDWHFDRGNLQYAIIRTEERRPRMQGGVWSNKTEHGYYLLVRAGFTEFGEDFQRGGWWMYDSEKTEIDRGNWDRTDGEIPLAVAYWERDANHPDGGLSRSGSFELGNLAVAYMNHESAARNSLWRAAGGITWILGADGAAMDIIRPQWEGGSPIVGVPAILDADGKPSAPPSIAYSQAAAADSAAHVETLKELLSLAREQALREATSAPESSGESKKAGFGETKSPRLRYLAGNIESFANTFLRFCEMRWGNARPAAELVLPKDYDLAPVEQDIAEFFETWTRTRLRSTIIETEAALRLARAKGLVDEDTEQAARTELEGSVRETQTAQSRMDGLLREAGLEPEGLAA